MSMWRLCPGMIMAAVLTQPWQSMDRWVDNCTSTQESLSKMLIHTHHEWISKHTERSQISPNTYCMTPFVGSLRRGEVISSVGECTHSGRPGNAWRTWGNFIGWGQSSVPCQGCGLHRWMHMQTIPGEAHMVCKCYHLPGQAASVFTLFFFPSQVATYKECHPNNKHYLWPMMESS